MKVQKPAPEKKRIHMKNFAKGKSRLIDINEVCYRTGYGKSTILRKVREKGFVQPIRVKSGVSRWLESDIDKWIDDLVEAAK